jgi:protein-tyrosine-phosphatase
MSNKPDKLHLLFVCVENSNRSQMAEAFAHIHGGASVEAWSCGSRPSEVVNPKAVAAMAELGYDLAGQQSKGLSDIPQTITWDYVITMGCGDNCPFIPARHRADWAVPDPRHMEAEEFNKVRDEIENRVKQLLNRLETKHNE